MSAPDLARIHFSQLHRNPGDGTAEIITETRDKPAKTPRPPGTALIAWSAGLLAVLAGIVLAVSYDGQFTFVYGARHQVLAAGGEAGMWDVGMVIFAMLGLGLAFARKSSRVERVLVMVCSFGSAAMNYAAADPASPRSVLAYCAPPMFLAACVDRVIAVIRRHRLADDEGSPWAPLGRATRTTARVTGLILLYLLRLALEPGVTARGLRRVVLNAAPLPAAPAAVPQVSWQAPPGTSKKAQLITLYQQDRRHGDRSLASRAAADLAPKAGLQAGTARTYINEYLASLNGSAS